MKNRSRGTRSGMQKRSKHCTGDQSNVISLPLAILVEVLFRLPIVSIMACKRVCKTWYEAIKSPEFANFYASNSQFTRFVLNNREPHLYSGHQFSLVETSTNGNCFQTPMMLKIPGRIRDSPSLTVVGSCRGFLCVKLESTLLTTIYISNLMTGECKALPAYERQLYNNIMFGFSSLRNCFKVIRAHVKSRGDRMQLSSGSCRVGIDRCWRKSTHLPMMPGAHTGKIHFVNEFFHWIGKGFTNALSIHTFDIGKETLGKITKPPGVKLDMSNTDLAVLGNNLCLVESIIVGSHHTHTFLWTLREHGVGSSWTKFFGFCSPSMVIPMSLSREGDIIVKYGSSLVSTDCNKIPVTVTTFETFEWKPFTTVWVGFDPSFLSLKDFEHVESSDDSDED